MAFILQVLFGVMSAYSLCVIVMAALNNQIIKKKQWKQLLIPIWLLFMAIAFRFDWETNSNNDLSRFFWDFRNLKTYGLSYTMRHADEFSWLYKLIAYAFSHLPNYHWYPVFTVGFEYGVFFYILTDVADNSKLTAREVLMCLVLRLALLPLIMSISASRNTLAYTFFVLGVYMHYKHGLKNKWVYIFMLMGVFIHTTVALGIFIFVISLLLKRYKRFVLILPFLSLTFGSLVEIMQTSGSEYIRYFLSKWDAYISSPNQYELIKTQRMMTFLVPLLVSVLVWFVGRSTSPKKDRISYLVTNMAVTVGVSGIMPEMFLRLCYPTALLMPLFFAEFANTARARERNTHNWELLFIIIMAIAFVFTRFCWAYEISWFLKI